MDTHTLIDAQFDRAVEIIQSLPKTGPIQTGYEEKLTMYSLYKQATVGNVKTPRPGIWDMLGRAKWDAWAKHKDLDSYEAKWLYVDALLKVLRKYSDKTVARDLVRELESYEGDPSNIIMSRTLSNRSPDSDSSGSESAAGVPGSGYHSGQLPAHLKNQLALQRSQQTVPEEGTSEDETSEEELHEVRVPRAASTHERSQTVVNRPQSSLSSHRYRTPMASSMLMSPPTIPTSQPLPGFETPSAFAGPSSASLPSSSYQATTPYSGQFARQLASPPTYPPQHGYQPALGTRQHALPGGLPPRPPSRVALERAIESVQAHLAALSERFEVLESRSIPAWTGYASPGPAKSGPSPTFAGRGSPSGRGRDILDWNFDQMGLWSIVLKVLSRVLGSMRQLATFLAHNENHSPTLIILRRLFLDVSFILCVLALMKLVWRKTGIRRREVSAAFRALWWALVGRSPPRVMNDRGV
ncbi:ACBP-domain-containing protein [Artomyces pyxidatus]|uniref:ACBP-domain-containing protein n=1 Tax=Artomyces pyxidatus TaxID=48021 RepID=A0ACB8TKM1_9AGAM|nr:ACBP-domain-containing protein [Artomyces pyxidatus]